MRLDSYGNLGLGVSPNNVNNFKTFTLNGTTGGNIEFQDQGTLIGSIYNLADQFIIQGQGSTIPVAFRTNSTERMRIAADGNVGIGKSNPNTTFEIYEDTNPYIYLQNSTTGTTATDGFSIVEFGLDAYINNREAGNMIFYNNGSERMRIDSSGNIAIGTTSPTAFGPTLQVAGTDPCFLLQDTANAVDYFGTNIGSGLVTNWYDDAAAWRIGTATGIAGSSYSEKMRIDSSGRLLVGISSSPTSGSGQYGKLVSAGNTLDATGDGRLILARGKNVGQLAHNDELGGIYFTDSLGNAFSAIRSQVGHHPGANDFPGTLKFYTTPNNSNSLTERMLIDQNGRVLIHNTTALEVSGTDDNANIGVFYALNNNATANAAVAAFATATNSTGTSNVLIKFGMNGYASGQGQINANGSGQVAFGTFSDRRLKENIVDLPSQWENIKNLRPVEFDYIASQGGEHQIGFIAQEFETVYPDAVALQPGFNGADESSTEERLTITDWSKTDTRLVKALQEAMERIETLEAKVAALEAG
jgi:hypothetical protein